MRTQLGKAVMVQDWTLDMPPQVECPREIRMYKFEAYQQMSDDIAQAIGVAVSRHGFGHQFHPLVVYAVLNTVGSPLKSLIAQGPLARSVGMKGIETFYASRIAAAVEVLKSPSSLIVNPMMDAIAFAILKNSGLTANNLLLRNTLRVLLNRPRLSNAGLPAALRKDSSLEPAFHSALGYLEQGSVIARAADGAAWTIAI